MAGITLSYEAGYALNEMNGMNGMNGLACGGRGSYFAVRPSSLFIVVSYFPF
jgi:hypothetical protein